MLGKYWVRKNNKGFSLIELIVVIAIIGVMATIVSVGLVPIFSKRAQKSAHNVDDLISQCKIYTMSGRQVMLRIYYNTSLKKQVAELVEYTMDLYHHSSGAEDSHPVPKTVLERCELGSDNLHIIFSRMDGENEYKVYTTLTSDDGASALGMATSGQKKELIILFDAKTGAVSWAGIRDRGYKGSDGDSAFRNSSTAYTQIHMIYYGKHYLVRLYKVTGRSEIIQVGG